MSRIKYSDTHTEQQRRKLEKLKQLFAILEKCDNDFQRAIELRRIYPNLKSFMQAYYIKRRFNEAKTERIVELIDDYSAYEEKLQILRDYYEKYTENGFFEVAKNEDIFLIKNAGNLDSRFVINEYINDEHSYDLEQFFSRIGICRTVFEASVKRVEGHDPELYSKYLKKVNQNRYSRVTYPMYNINQILMGIKEGTTIDGKPFDIFEFYKLAPFKGKDIDAEIRGISNSFKDDNSEDSVLKTMLANLKDNFSKKKRDYVYNDGAHRFCAYNDNLYLFLSCFNEEQAEVLREYMNREENNVKNLTPIYKESKVSCYPVDEEAEFTRDDALEVFDIMDENEYPRISEVFELLKARKINEKKNKSLNLLNEIK